MVFASTSTVGSNVVELPALTGAHGRWRPSHIPDALPLAPATLAGLQLLELRRSLQSSFQDVEAWLADSEARAANQSCLRRARTMSR